MDAAPVIALNPSFVSGVLGATCGALLTRILSRRREQVAMAFDMHKEFSSAEMAKHRRRGGRFVEKYPTTDYDSLAALEEEDSLSVLTVMRFYQRLWLAIEHRQIRLQLTHELFSEVFYYWYYASYQHNLNGLSWVAAEQMDKLMEWFEKNDKQQRYKQDRKEYEQQRKVWIFDAEARKLEKK